jgi:hypothetical protein
MPTAITRDQFLAALREGRARWEAALAAIPAARMEEPGVSSDGRWSPKDVIGHVLWHEREMIGVVQARALVGSELWQRPLAERNQLIYASYQEQSLADVLAGAAAAWRTLLPLLEGLSEAELNDPARFAEMPPEWVPWDLIAGNTYRHYAEHAEQIERWLARPAGGA